MDSESSWLRRAIDHYIKIDVALGLLVRWAGKKFLASNYHKVTYPATVDENEFKKPE